MNVNKRSVTSEEILRFAQDDRAAVQPITRADGTHICFCSLLGPYWPINRRWAAINRPLRAGRGILLICIMCEEPLSSEDKKGTWYGTWIDWTWPYGGQHGTETAASRTYCRRLCTPRG